MKVRIKYGPVELEGEGSDHREVFEQLAALTEVFRDEECGVCKHIGSTLRVRRVADPKSKGKKEFEYYERVCPCGAKLSYGCHLENRSLFPKRKLEDGTWDKKHRGWTKYVKPAGEAS